MKFKGEIQKKDFTTEVTPPESGQAPNTEKNGKGTYRPLRTAAATRDNPGPQEGYPKAVATKAENGEARSKR